jgi:thymidylate kinase
MDKGIFVTFEGIDACGKSYLAQKVHQKLQEQNKSAIVNWKQDITGYHSRFFKEAVKTYITLAEKMEAQIPSSPLMDLLSASGFTILYNEMVYPLVREGVTVISDSWCFKGMARQLVNAQLYGTPEGIDNYKDWLFQVHRPALRIDHSFFLDTPVEICWERRKMTIHETGQSIGIAGSDKHRFLTYQTALRHVLLAFAHQFAWHRLTGDTHEMIAKILEVFNEC